MTDVKRCAQAAAAVAVSLVLAAGCGKEVTGRNAMPQNPSLPKAQKRQAMIRWHQQHDRPPAAVTPQGG